MSEKHASSAASPSRRAAMSGAAAAVASGLLGATIAHGAQETGDIESMLRELSPEGLKQARELLLQLRDHRTLPPQGQATFSIDGRIVLVDLGRRPTLKLDLEDTGRGRTVSVLHSIPEDDAEYLVLRHDGELAVAQLVHHDSMPVMWPYRNNLGFQPTEDAGGSGFAGMSAVQVLGQVVHEYA